MKRIDTTSLKPYYVEDNDAQIAKVGHVNAVIEAANNTFNPTLIDPAINGGIGVLTDFKVDLLTTVQILGESYQGYKLAVAANVSDPVGVDNYVLFLGAIKVAPGTSIRLSGVSGTVFADASIFVPTTIGSMYTAGAEVTGTTVPGIYQLNFADVALQQNPFDSTEYAVLAYLESTGNDFEATIALEVNILVTYGASFTYLRD
jgi:hypothetical protein